MPKKCLLISGGEYAPLPEAFRENIRYDLVIACDRGYANARKLGIRPDLLIGDFDSLESEPETDIPVIRLNPVKDDTDTMSAVRYALREGCTEVTICCAFGGRFDHSLANVQTAAFLEDHGARAVICGRGTVLYSLKNAALTLARVPDSYLSVFSVSDVCAGVSISGTKYTLENAEITNRFPIGVSNEWTEETARVSVKNGLLIVIVSRNVRLS